MLRPEVIRRRLDKIEEYLAVLERSRGYTLDDFLADPEHFGSAERFLQLIIESLTDASMHVIAELELGTVNSAGDVPRLFKTHGYIDEPLEERWLRMIGFRNILVHDYLDVDRTVVHRVLQEGLDDVRVLAGVLAGFL